MLTGLIHWIGVRAERRVEKELIGELAGVPGKRGILRRMVTAALDEPDGTVREVVYPAVPGREKMLRDLARELMATERVVAERVRYQLRGSYSHHYRRMLAPLLATLRFRCNNRDCRPVMDAIELLARYAGAEARASFAVLLKPERYKPGSILAQASAAGPGAACCRPGAACCRSRPRGWGTCRMPWAAPTTCWASGGL